MNLKNIQYIFEKNKESVYKENNVEIISVNDKKNFNEFYKIPWMIYKGDKKWAPPLWSEIDQFFKINNFFWDHTDLIMFIAKKNNKNVGRIAGFIDRKYCEGLKNNIGFFGFFESINDKEIFSLLIHKLEDWFKKNDVKKIMGPINGRVDMGCGFVYKGFNYHPIFPDKYSLKYYIDLFENNNFKKSRDFYNYYIDLTKPMPKTLENEADICRKNFGVKIRRFNRLRSKREIDWWSNFMISTFTNHWGYVPVKTDEIKERYGIKNIRWFVDNKLFLIAEKDKIPIGFSWTFPDYNQIFKNMDGKFNFLKYLKFYFDLNIINQANMNIIGIEKKFHNHSVASLLNFTTITELKRRGYIRAEIGMTDEKNIASQRIIEKTGAKPHKIFRIFEKNINI